MDDPQPAIIYVQVSLFLFLVAQIFIQPETLHDSRCYVLYQVIFLDKVFNAQI